MRDSDIHKSRLSQKFLLICFSFCALTVLNFSTSKVHCQETKSEETKEEVSPKKSVDVQSILSLWTGEWNSEKTVKTSSWIKKEIKEVESKVGSRILDKKFIEIISKSEKQTTKEIHGFNQHTNKFQKFTFDTNGNTSFWTGTWNDDAKIMTWHLNSDVVTGIIVDRFSSSDNSSNLDICQNTFVMTDKDGNILLDIASTSKLKK